MQKGNIIQYVTNSGRVLYFLMLNEDKCAELVKNRDAADFDKCDGALIYFIRPDVPAAPSNGLEYNAAAVTEIIYGGLEGQSYRVIGNATPESVEDALNSLIDIENAGDESDKFVRLVHIKDRLDDEQFFDEALGKMNNQMEFGEYFKTIHTQSLREELFREAIRRENMPCVNICLNEGIYPDLRMEDGKTALTWALKKNKLELPRRLVLAGADLSVAQHQLGKKAKVSEEILDILKIISNRPVSDDLKRGGING